MVQSVSLAAVGGAVATVAKVREMMVTGQAGKLILVSILLMVV